MSASITILIGGPLGVFFIFVAVIVIVAVPAGFLIFRKGRAVRLVIDVVCPDEDRRTGATSTAAHVRAAAGGGDAAITAIRIYNDSGASVTVADVGIRVNQPHAADLVLEHATTLDGASLPLRLAPQAACVIPLRHVDAWNLARREIVAVFARTNDGREFRMSGRKLADLPFST